VLYDLIDGYINAQGAPEIRPGTVIDHVVPAGTVGLVAHQDKLHVFSHEPVVMTDPEYVCDVLRHPTDGNLAIAAIPFAESFMQVLYVVARFENGDVYHYWLRRFDAWEANTTYSHDQLVEATDDTGYLYRASRLTAATEPVWAPRTERAVDDVVAPTVYTGFTYRVIAVFGPSPRSGTVEPAWPVVEDGQVIETSDIPMPINDVPTPGVPPRDDGGGGLGTDIYDRGFRPRQLD
jgi:hypothetical protein